MIFAGTALLLLIFVPATFVRLLRARAFPRRGDEPTADLDHDAAGADQRAAGIHGSLARRRAISWTSAGRPSPVTAEMA